MRDRVASPDVRALEKALRSNPRNGRKTAIAQVAKTALGNEPEMQQLGLPTE